MRRSWLRTCLVLICLSFCVPVYAQTQTHTLAIRDSVVSANQTDGKVGKPFLLRILPLGASITCGYRSEDGNGYRKWLRQQLRFAGWGVDMVGGLRNGSMSDNENEGHFGYRIDQITAVAEHAVRLQPNVILLNIGTNDALQSRSPATAGSRLDTLLTHLFTSIPGTTILLSTLLPNTKAAKNIRTINAQYRTVAARRRAAGDKLILAEMAYFITPSDLVDGVHPTDWGYKAMAAVWWAGIQEAEREGFLTAPNRVARMAVMSEAEMRDLDEDGTGDGDPGLPGYVAAPQPGRGGATQEILRGGLMWGVGGWVMVLFWLGL